MIGSAGESISTSGTGTVILIVVLQQFSDFGLNSVLGNVRNLQFVTHLMMMQLIYSAGVTLFFSTLLDFVTYDIIPTDEIYSEIFKL